MGIMYGQVSNSISILERVRERTIEYVPHFKTWVSIQVKVATEGYVNKTGKNLGTMEGQVEGLTDRYTVHNILQRNYKTYLLHRQVPNILQRNYKIYLLLSY